MCIYTSTVLIGEARSSLSSFTSHDLEELRIGLISSSVILTKLKSSVSAGTWPCTSCRRLVLNPLYRFTSNLRLFHLFLLIVHSLFRKTAQPVLDSIFQWFFSIKSGIGSSFVAAVTSICVILLEKLPKDNASQDLTIY